MSRREHTEKVWGIEIRCVEKFHFKNFTRVMGRFETTVKTGYKNHLNRGNSGYRGHFAADRFFYLIKTS